MYTKQEIILQSYREGKSQQAISGELSISRKTVKKYIEEYNSKVDETGEQEKAITSFMTEPPMYQIGSRNKVRLTVEVRSIIDDLLAKNSEKRALGQAKQVLKKIDILEYLHSQGHIIGYTTVRNYIRVKAGKRSQKEAFIRQQYEPGGNLRI